MKRERIYWICQLSGWSTYIVANMLIFAAFGGGWKTVLSEILICGVGLVLTHGFRIFIKRRRWIHVPLAALVPRIVVACIVLALAWEVVGLAILILVLRSFTLKQTQLGIVLGTLFSWGATLLIWSLIYFGFHYVENYKRTEVERWRLESAVKDAELRALKSQMNPHFIFNCLNNIRALIAEDPERAQTVVTQLANILRYSLRSGSAETVSLAEELQIVADYLALEKTRLEERLHVTMNIDPKSLGILVPPMLLQTLIENGIKHGVARFPGHGEIILDAQVRERILQIQITNTGQLLESSNPSGVGLANAAERLKLLFGNAASLSLKVSSPNHVTANIEIPIEAPQS